MATPQSYKKKLGWWGAAQGKERREELKEEITNKDTFLPKGVLHEDLEKGFQEFVKKDLELSLKGTKVPVIALGLQAWNEYSKTWNFTDEYKNIKIPFISIVRQPDTQKGTHPGLIHNIPRGRKYIYAEVPTWDGHRKGVDLYKIPQPIPIDIVYDVRFFSYRIRDFNAFNRVIHKKFQSLQAYYQVNGHYIPCLLEKIGDETEAQDLEKKRFYIQLYTIRTQGFIIDPQDFEIVPMVNRIFTITETQKNC